MLTNTQKYDYYVKTLAVVQGEGWTKKSLETYSGVCTVGAINRATTGRAEPHWSDNRRIASHEMQEDFLSAIPRHYISAHTEGFSTSGDGGLRGIEQWNDMPWRRKHTVVRLLKKRIAHYKPLAEKEQLQRYQKLVRDLRKKLDESRAKVAALETRVLELENENRFLRKSRQKFTANELRNESTAMADLDAQLDTAMAELQKRGINA